MKPHSSQNITPDRRETVEEDFRRIVESVDNAKKLKLPAYFSDFENPELTQSEVRNFIATLKTDLDFYLLKNHFTLFHDLDKKNLDVVENNIFSCNDFFQNALAGHGQRAEEQLNVFLENLSVLHARLLAIYHFRFIYDIMAFDIDPSITDIEIAYSHYDSLAKILSEEQFEVSSEFKSLVLEFKQVFSERLEQKRANLRLERIQEEISSQTALQFGEAGKTQLRFGTKNSKTPIAPTNLPLKSAESQSSRPSSLMGFRAPKPSFDKNSERTPPPTTSPITKKRAAIPMKGADEKPATNPLVDRRQIAYEYLSASLYIADLNNGVAPNSISRKIQSYASLLLHGISPGSKKARQILLLQRKALTNLKMQY